MAGQWSARVIALGVRDDPTSSDPRVGSARNGSTGGTLSHVTSSGTNSASASSLGSTFVPVVVYSAICLLIFITLRRKCLRVYSPKSLPDLRQSASELSPSLPTGWFNWIIPFFRIPQRDVLKYASLDGFLFLRYLRVLALLCFGGVVFAWPILLPVHATGGNTLMQLDLLTIGNVDNPIKYYAHVLTAWCFFGFTIYLISRECVYYINLRQAYLLSPDYVHRISSRTVLFTCVPRDFLDEARVRKLFGDSAKNVWIPRNTRILQGLVTEREKLAVKLEAAEIELIKRADKARRKRTSEVTTNNEHTRAAISSPTRTSWTSTAEKDTLADPGVPVSPRSTHHSTSEAPQISLQLVPSTISLPFILDNKETAQTHAPSADDAEYTFPYGLQGSFPDVRGSVAAQWIPAEDRPTYRPWKNFFRSVDTIRWCRLKIRILNQQIGKLRKRLRRGNGYPISAVFVEFDSLTNAQAAFQILAHHQPLHMSPRFIGVRPNEIVWSTLRMKWWERIMRRFGVMGLIAVAVIFWSIPSAFVGMISNLKYLSDNVVFLSWTKLIPTVILGFIQGLLPALALSLLMMLVPSLIRRCARMAGVPTQPLVELYCQSAYFVFQVVQVFLITTITSAASSAVTQILQDPMSVKDLLSQSLPKASNFYLSYILVQCLAGAATGFLHIPDLFRRYVIARTTDSPRRLFRTWHRLRQVHWGAVYPVFSNMGVIILSYSCIAPLILGFAGIGMLFAGVVYKYNLIYVFDSGMDTHGLFYPRALMHLMVGLYLAEICLIGLFAIKAAVGPVALMVVFLIFTALVHMSLSDAVSSLFFALPRSLAMASEENSGSLDSGIVNLEARHPQQRPETQNGAGAAADYYNMQEDLEDQDPDDAIHQGVYAMRDRDLNEDYEEPHGIISKVVKWTSDAATKKIEEEISGSAHASAIVEKLKYWTTPNPDKPANFLSRWLHPELYESFFALRQMIPANLPAAEPSDDDARRCYWPREMWLRPPRLWIPKDEARVSRQEVAHTRDLLPISDKGAWLNKKGKVEVDLNQAPWRGDGTIYWKFEYW